jgi:hypothetical protein
MTDKPKHAGGRPTDYKPEYCDIVRNLMKEGASKVEIALELDICVQTLDNWMDKNPEFFKAFKEAIDFSEGWWCKEGRINLGNKNFNSRLWEINMMNRFGWMKKAANNEESNLNMEFMKELALKCIQQKS